MDKLRILLLTGFAIATVCIFWGGDQARAGSNVSTITGNFRDPETVVVKHRKITNSEREEAAKRLAVSRAAALKKGATPATAVPKPVASPNEKGGTNE